MGRQAHMQEALTGTLYRSDWRRWRIDNCGSPTVAKPWLRKLPEPVVHARLGIRLCLLAPLAQGLGALYEDLPFDTEWVLAWAHVGRMFRHVDCSFTPLAHGRLTAKGPACGARVIATSDCSETQLICRVECRDAMPDGESSAHYTAQVRAPLMVGAHHFAQVFARNQHEIRRILRAASTGLIAPLRRGVPVHLVSAAIELLRILK